MNWTFDAAHSELNFKVKHMMIANVSGSFGTFDVQATSDGANFENPKIEFTAETASISTGNEQRDGHLRSGDFFDAETFPQLKFKSTSWEKDDDDEFELHGDLTIRDVTLPVKLEVEFGGVGKDPWGQTKAGFSVKGKINRKDFGLNWNSALEAGGVLVGEDVKISAEIQLIQQAAA